MSDLYCMVKLKQLFHVGIFIIAGVSCFFQSVAQTNNSKDFGKTALQESIIPIHPGIPGKTPFWNIYAKRFIYAPAFNYKSIPGAKKYRYEIKSLKHSDIFSFENNIPNAPLSPVWKKIPVGYFIIKVTGISANGDSLGLAGQGRYWEADKATGKKIYLAKAKSIANTLTWVQSKHNGDYPSFFTNNDMPLWLNGVVYPAKIMMELKKNIENLKKRKQFMKMKTSVKHNLVMCIAFVALFTYGCSSGQSVKHVVLISLDGSRPVFYMDTSWPAPHLQKLKDEGVYAAKGIESVFPSVTYPSHTAIITGAYPVHHGIYYNAPFGGSPGQWYWNFNAIKCKTLWSAVKQAGMTSGAVMWPVTVGAPINYNFPVRRPEKGESGNKLTIKYPYITPKNLLNDVEKKTGITFTPASLGTRDYAQSKTIAIISNYIIKTYKPNLMAIHFVGIDHAEHKYGTDGPQIRAVVRVTDSLVGTVLQAIKDAGIWNSTAIIITGDHGHTDTKATFAPNVYLTKAGLITDHKNWRAIFHAAGGSAFLYLKNKKDQATLDSVIYILKNTPEYKQGDFRILDRAILNKMGANPEVALALAMKQGITANNRFQGKTFELHKGHPQSTHGYDPAYPSMHTTFIAIGAGIAKHKNITGMGIKDIAPVIAKLLGLDFKAPDGKLIPGIVQKK